MKVLFLGVGEAFDERLPNNAHLILSESSVLLDCGYSIPPSLWRYNNNQSFLDAIYISHTHADHYFGLPAILTRMWEDGRKKSLTIICPKGIKETIQKVIRLGYQGILEKINFDLEFLEAEENETIRFRELLFSFAGTAHSAQNFAVKIDDGRHTVCYSGDGMFNDQTERLYRQADLVIHEAYSFDNDIPGHANIKALIAMAERNHVKCIALTHLHRAFRKNDLEDLKKRCEQETVTIIIPEPLSEYVL
jgi:ribonuclease BN (tRNA processing enzyme)